MGLRTDLEQSVREALESAGTSYYPNLSVLLEDARRLGLVSGIAIDSSFDHWHIQYWGEKLVSRYGYHYNGMMNRAFPGIHPMTVYDLTDGCFVLITPPPFFNPAEEVTALDALKLCEERLGLSVTSLRGDRGTASVDLTKSLAAAEMMKQPAPPTYYLAIRSNSILRRHIRGRGWVTDRETTGERACLRKGLDYHGVETNLVALSKQDRRDPSKKKRRVFLFITNDGSTDDPFQILRQYRMRGEHERNLGCLTALGVKHLPSTENEKEIAGHLLTFMKLQFLLMLLRRRLGIAENCEPRTLVNLLLRKPGMSWVEEGPDGEERRRTIIFANRAVIKKVGRTTLRFKGHEVTLIERWRSRSRPRVSDLVSQHNRTSRLAVNSPRVGASPLRIRAS